ncbi:upstream activation factor subunit UAF30-like isoform X1 [Hibiscus syriacus]|uniref:upstream activation factor subunit UAF30-like isoform X1 n=1 Tax=Hibiscus syriacus TaxID=106335 RepID=UPI0019205EAF|nr:upstream activation factor subunit UAF30-like isoform X1 [Hibiscus syriacus]
MASDLQLIARLWEFLDESDLNTTTTAIVRRRLEQDFAIDLTDRKKFIREQVDLYLQSQFENADQQQQEDDLADENKSEETDGSDSDEQEKETQRAKNKRASSKKLPKRVDGEGKRRGGGFNKVSRLSPQLQELLGVPELARTEVVKQIWVYIREKNLQDPVNKKNIICDEPLHALFGVDSIDMFLMNKALSKHILPLDSDEVKSMEKEKPLKHEREEEPDEEKGKEKKQKGFLAPLQLSDALVKFLGTGENELTRATVIKRMWDYIKENNLQDPSDKRKVICDEKLKVLFDVETFHGFTVTKLLAAHFLKS